MKHLLLLFSLLMSVNLASAQSAKKVQWTYSSKKIADKTYEVYMTANINDHWHLYSQGANGDNGVAATVIHFAKNPLLILNGKPREVGKMIRKKEEALGMVLNYYEKTVSFVQVVKLKADVKTEVAGQVEFTVCGESVCLPTSQLDFKVVVGS